ncbi:MAG: hypothetical protein ACTSXK_18115 [Promethearchaeota archaeon]
MADNHILKFQKLPKILLFFLQIPFLTAFESFYEVFQSKYNKGISPENINYIENFFRLIGNKIEGFQFIRLKETIRCNSNSKDIDLNKELTKIDKLFTDWEQNPNRNNKVN